MATFLCALYFVVVVAVVYFVGFRLLSFSFPDFCHPKMSGLKPKVKIAIAELRRRRRGLEAD